MFVLTPAERRVAALVAFLLCLGTAYDLWPRGAGTGLAPADSLASVAVPSAGTSPTAEGASDTPMTRDAPALGAPTRGEPFTPAAAADTASHGPAIATVDLNHATATQLDALPGIGPVLARRIVEHRSRFGPFRDPRDVRAVTGVGPKLYARIRPYVYVSP